MDNSSSKMLTHKTFPYVTLDHPIDFVTVPIGGCPLEVDLFPHLAASGRPAP